MMTFQNDPIPANLLIIVIDEDTAAYLEGYICNGTMVSLIDPKDNHRYVVSADRVKK